MSVLKHVIMRVASENALFRHKLMGLLKTAILKEAKIDYKSYVEKKERKGEKPKSREEWEKMVGISGKRKRFEEKRKQNPQIRKQIEEKHQMRMKKLREEKKQEKK